MARNYPSRVERCKRFAGRLRVVPTLIERAWGRVSPSRRVSDYGRDLASHPINALVASRDLFPIEVLKKFRDVLFSTRVIVRVGVLTHVAHDERVGAEPDAVVVAIHDRIVPAVVVRIVHEDGPA